MKKEKKNPLRIMWLILGFLAMGIGAVGVILPVLPTTPFLLLASFCLARGSERFHRWFTGTKLYRRHLESFVRNRAMTLKTKFSLLIPASCMLILAFLAMSNVYGRVFIIFLIFFKYIYFFTKIRTVPAGQTAVPEAKG
ncbi:MAG: YbaN family protein [Mediterraneibacter sp.]